MKPTSQIIIDYINQKLKEHATPKGRHPYHLSDHISTLKDDESEFITLIYTSNFRFNNYTEENEFWELNSKLLNSINLEDILKEQGYTKLIEQETLITYITSYNDTVHLQTTDHSIYVTILNSGQY